MYVYSEFIRFDVYLLFEVFELLILCPYLINNEFNNNWINCSISICFFVSNFVTLKLKRFR